METTFSLFSGPITSPESKTPDRDVTLESLHGRLVSCVDRAKTESLRSLATVKERREFKKRSFDFATFSGSFSKRKKDGLIRASNYICLDFDHLPSPPEDFKERFKQDGRFFPLLMFTSPSGDGLKVVLRMNPDWGSLEDYLTGMNAFFFKEYGVPIDTVCRDVTRACFLPYDPAAYYAVESDDAVVFDPRPYLGKDMKKAAHEPASEIPLTDREHVEHVVREIEARGISIAPDYESYLNVGFAFADAFGESGRDLYHRVCRPDPKYDASEADKQYSSCLKSKGHGVTLGTFFKYAQDNGIDISVARHNNGMPALKGASATGARESVTEQEPDLPTFSDKIKELVPDILSAVINYYDDSRSRDIAVLGFLTVLSSCLPGIHGLYHRISYSPHLYTYIEGLPGSGKGAMAPVVRMVSHIEKDLMHQYEMLMASYMAEHRQWEDSDKTTPEPKAPARMTVRLPGNTTSAAIVIQMKDNNPMASNGLIFETEADTLFKAIESQHGQFSDVLRNAFHHEEVSYMRKTDNILINIEKPSLAICLSGTPCQTHSLIRGVEDGLFSRFSFYHVKSDLVWKDPFAFDESEAADAFYSRLGEHFYEHYYSVLKKGPGARFRLKKKQQATFNSVFSRMTEICVREYGVDQVTSVFRLGLSTFRYAMVIGTLRAIESGESLTGDVYCDDESFSAAMEIGKAIIQHDINVYGHMPLSQASFGNRRKQQFLSSLPDYPAQFTRKQCNAIAIQNRQNPRTIGRYLTEFVNSGLLLRVDENLYEKPQKS